MKKVLFILFLSSCCKIAFTQKQNNIWYFGGDDGISFNFGTPVALTNGVMDQLEGCATISDNNGNLLFFTDGTYVWDRNFNMMPNGAGLMGNWSATQSALIVPEPGNCNVYFIFTVPAQNNSIPFSYSIVDMSLNGGLGDISSKNISLYTPVPERLTATLQSNSKDYWIVSQIFGTNAFLVYSLTSEGVNTTPVISYSGPVMDNTVIGNLENLNAIGYLKFSPDGSKLCYADPVGYSQLFDFDYAKGIVSNNIPLIDSLGYGVEFSPDNSKLYISTWHPYPYVVTQYDLSAGSASAIQNSAKEIVNEKYNADNTFKYGGSLQLAPDGKIYSAVVDEYFLSVINKPNLRGKLCEYADTGIVLTGQCLNGLPNNIKQFGSTSSCSLPVTLLNFTSTTINKTVNLQWQTTTEINSDYFSIERSSNGINFSNIGKETAAGNSNSLKQYSFIDNNPLSLNYYRLKEVDLDGSVSYSKILLVKMPQAQPLIIIGNPVQNVLQVQVNISSSQTSYLSIFDFMSRRLKTFNAQNGLQNIDVSFLPAGTYILQMTAANGEVFDKIFMKR